MIQLNRCLSPNIQLGARLRGVPTNGVGVGERLPFAQAPPTSVAPPSPKKLCAPDQEKVGTRQWLELHVDLDML